MSPETIHLRVLLPDDVFLDCQTVTSLTVRTVTGSFGVLPKRQDCVVGLKPGILTFRSDSKETSVALDEGILMKTGPSVDVAVRNAIGGAELGKLHEAINQQFLKLDEQELEVKTAVARLESSLIQTMVEFQRAS